MGFDSLHSAKTILGMTIFVQASLDAKINWISKKILGYKVLDQKGELIGCVDDVMWLPTYDAYIVKK